jgi:hypothetical protein
MNHCKLCNKVAWYHVPRPSGAEYYCGDHKAKAVEVCTAENLKNERSGNRYSDRIGVYAQQQVRYQ